MPHVSSSGAAGEKRENGCSAADFEDDVAGADGLGDGFGIGGKARPVADHGAEIAKRVGVAH